MRLTRNKPNFARRAQQEELMDDLNCRGEVVIQTLRELDFINRVLGGNGLSLQALTQIYRRFPQQKALDAG
ncbi:MAG: SAM-dependent methyltransferase, partial [Cytophagales bacterium]|nr:SAM-dependent methyltransferase [Cytophagales bacterium]